MELLARFTRFMRERGHSRTRTRLAVARVLFATPAHLSVVEIQHRLRSRGEHVGTATIYRALAILLESGLAQEHDFSEGYKRYQAVQDGQPHAHLICQRCGRVIEFTHERLDRMLQLVADEHRFLPQRYRVEVHGRCAECRTRDVDAVDASRERF